MVRTVALVVHIATGVAGLVLGPVALVTTLRHHRFDWTGEAYHGSVLVVTATAVVLTFFDWSGLWWFVPIAAASYAFALLGYLSAKRRWPRWRPTHVRGQGGAYIALWTAVLVVSANDYPVLWFVPVVVGTPLVELVSHRLARREVTPGTGPTRP
ncbi:MAG: hypothetical protein ACRD29_19320 [Acidimicrobiales bacterium]